MKKLSIIMLMLLLVLSVGLVSAGPNDLPGNGWTSGQQIQNVGNASGVVNLTAYDQAGAPTNCGDQPLDPGESYTYLPETDCPGMPPGFEGSAVASADQPIAAVVNVNNRSVGKAAGQYTGTDGSEVQPPSFSRWSRATMSAGRLPSMSKTPATAPTILMLTLLLTVLPTANPIRTFLPMRWSSLTPLTPAFPQEQVTSVR
jgi:hypothetical protein